jgi:DNA repair exonuclease SbcCD ATPase subunit
VTAAQNRLAQLQQAQADARRLEQLQVANQAQMQTLAAAVQRTKEDKEELAAQLAAERTATAQLAAKMARLQTKLDEQQQQQQQLLQQPSSGGGDDGPVCICRNHVFLFLKS